jgi:hypothetical protein
MYVGGLVVGIGVGLPILYVGDLVGFFVGSSVGSYVGSGVG